MEFMTFLIALAAAFAAFASHSKLSNLKLEIGRLRRDLDNALRLAELERPLHDSTRSGKSQPLKAAALKNSQLQKTTPVEPKAPTAAPADVKPLQPEWQKLSEPEAALSKKPRKSFEEAIGAQWSVWVGGLALFLGAVFLLRYSIEAGVFSPAMRIAMASTFGVALLGASEWLLRIDQKGAKPSKLAAKLGVGKDGAKTEKGTLDTPAFETQQSVLETAYIPGVLAAVGIFALLGAAYASYALYDFISPTPAFILLGLISMGAMALSLRHGPILAALGLAASLATPLLVPSDVPNVYLLYGYLIIIASTAISAARMRKWGWLTLLTLTSLLGWSFLSFDAVGATSTLPVWYGFLGLGFFANVWLAQNNHVKNAAEKTAKKQTDISDWQHNSTSALAWGGAATFLIVAAVVTANLDYPRALPRLNYGLGLGAATAFFAASFVLPRQKEHVFSGAAIGAMTVWATLNAKFGVTEVIVTGLILSAAVIFLTTRPIFKPALFSSAPSSETPAPNVLWPLFTAIFPVGLFSVMLNISGDVSDNLIAAIFASFALVNAALGYGLRSKVNVKNHASIFAISAAALYVLAAGLAFDGMAFTFAVLVGLMIAAAAAWKLGDPIVRLLVPAFAGLSVAHSLLIHLPSKDSVSHQLIFNELWIHFALPAVLCAGVAWLLKKYKTDLWSEGLKALALAFAALFVVFQIRHIMNGGQIFAGRLSFEELTLQVLTGFCFTLGGAKIGRQTIDPKGALDRNLIPGIMTAVSLVSLFAFAVGVCILKAPLFNGGEAVRGNFALNSLLIGYLLPAVMLSAIAYLGRGKRPEWYLRLAAGLAAVSVVLFVTSMIRFGFTGREISLTQSLPKGVELYAISAAWLILGIGTLIVGMKTDRQDVRLASAALITLTVLKAFLIDMASLEGVLRAMSFVVLGLVLIVIGRVYQKVLSRPREAQSG